MIVAAVVELLGVYEDEHYLRDGFLIKKSTPDIAISSNDIEETNIIDIQKKHPHSTCES